jgi:hypothetical protein
MIDDLQKVCYSAWIAELNTLWYVIFNHFFLSYYFFEFANFFSKTHITPS